MTTKLAIIAAAILSVYMAADSAKRAYERIEAEQPHQVQQ